MNNPRADVALLSGVMGHRGACGSAPENTLASVTRAAALGVRTVELDATVTADGVPVIHHDLELDRTTNGHGPILAHDWDELRDLDAGSSFDPAFAGERIPTLEQTFARVKALGLGLNLEIKPTFGWETVTAETIARWITRHWHGESPLLVSSFSYEALAIMRDLAPDVPRAYLAWVVPPDWRARLNDLRCVSLHCQHTFLHRENVAEIHEAGYVAIAYTVDDAEIARRLRADGVYGVVSNFPERLLPVWAGEQAPVET